MTEKKANVYIYLRYLRGHCGGCWRRGRSSINAFASARGTIVSACFHPAINAILVEHMFATHNSQIFFLRVIIQADQAPFCAILGNTSILGVFFNLSPFDHAQAGLGDIILARRGWLDLSQKFIEHPQFVWMDLTQEQIRMGKQRVVGWVITADDPDDIVTRASTAVFSLFTLSKAESPSPRRVAHGAPPWLCLCTR